MNSNVINEVRDALKIQNATEKIPNCIPIIEVGYKATLPVRLASLTKSTTGTGDIIATTANTKQLYIKYVSFSMIKDATCDVATGSLSLSATIAGAVKEIALIPVITLTAQSESINIVFNNPIKIDPNTAVTLGAQTFTAGVLVRTAVIGFFEDDYVKG